MFYGCIAGPIDGVRYMPKGRQMLAHRASWILHFGPIPEGEGSHGTVVMHKCDNPLCVNPAHLMLGTQLQNIKDMDSKERGNRIGLAPKTGTQHANHVFDKEQVLAIVSSTKTNGELAAEYGVSKHSIKRLRCGKTYADETNSAELRELAKNRKGLSRPGTSNPTSKLTDEQVRYIRSSTKTTYQIADELGVTQPTIASARRGATYKNVI
jgi:DNA-binding CsgD family transcriptional regulator